MRVPIRAGRAALAAALMGAVLVAGAAKAWAHVSSDPSNAETITDEAGITTVVLIFDHGCAGSPTIGLRVRLPEGTTEVSAQDPPGWRSRVEDGVISWQGTPIPDDAEGRFVFSARIVGTEGEVVYLPTVQICEVGTEDWIELPDPARPEEEPPSPAPAVVLSRTVPPLDGPEPTPPASDEPPATAITVPDGAPSGDGRAIGTPTQAAAGAEPGTTGLVVLVLVLVVIGGGALALFLRHRPTRP